MSIKKLMCIFVVAFIVTPLLAISKIAIDSFKEVQILNTIQNMQTAAIFQQQRVAEVFNKKVEDIRNLVEELQISDKPEYLSEDQIRYIHNSFVTRCNNGDYTYGMRLYDKNNNIVTSVENESLGIRDKISIDISTLKDVVITDIFYSESFNSFPYFYIIVPFFSQQGDYVGSISQTVGLGQFQEMLSNVNVFKTETESIIDDANIRVVSDNLSLTRGHVEQEFAQNFAKATSKNINSGTFRYKVGKDNFYCSYQSLKSYGWYYILNINENEIFLPINNIYREMFVVITIVVGFIIIIVMSMSSTLFKKLDNLILKIDAVNNGSYDFKFDAWSCDEIQKIIVSFNNLVSSVIKNKKRADKMLGDALAYKKAIEFASEIVFEADISNNKILSCSSDFISFDTMTYDEFWDNIVKEHVHKINWDEAKRIFSRDNIEYLYWEDIKSISKDCLYQQKVGEPYQWVSLNSITFCTEGRDMLKTIFYIQNINERKEKEISAIEQSKIDCLSNLYNKKFTQEMINDYIYTSVGEKKSAFVIMDIDNFKNINDTLGHIVGDNVITDVSSRIKRQFRGYDIIGRIGGDEFVVFMRDIGNTDLLGNIIENVIKALSFDIEIDGKSVSVSASAGVAVYPDNGKSYNELYRNADKALYKAKEGGKNRFCFYIDDKQNRTNKFLIDNLSDKLLVEFIRRFRKEQNKDNKKIIAEKLLQYIGKQHNVSRIYNVIVDDSQKNFHTTLEWCNNGIPHHMLGDVKRPLDIIEDYRDYFNEDCIFSCRDVRQLDSSYYNRLTNDGVIAVLQYAVIEDGKIKFCVGFDDCREKRYWSDEAVRCLYLIKEISEECF